MVKASGKGWGEGEGKGEWNKRNRDFVAPAEKRKRPCNHGICCSGCSQYSAKGKAIPAYRRTYQFSFSYTVAYLATKNLIRPKNKNSYDSRIHLSLSFSVKLVNKIGALNCQPTKGDNDPFLRTDVDRSIDSFVSRYGRMQRLSDCRTDADTRERWHGRTTAHLRLSAWSRK